MNAAEFLREFVVETDHKTGGNCTAWCLPLPDGFSVLVTDAADAVQPDATTRLVSVALLDADGDEHQVSEDVTWAAASAYVRMWVGAVPNLAAARHEAGAE
jgi:hypothetical protein